MNAQNQARPPILVFDASTLVSWLTQTVGQWQRVERLLRSPADCVMSVPALTETIYVARRHGNTSSPAMLGMALVAQGIRIEPSTAADAQWAASAIAEAESHPALWQTAHGARTGTLSLGDGLTLALAHRLGGYAVTFDQAWSHFPTQSFRVVDAWKVHQ